MSATALEGGMSTDQSSDSFSNVMSALLTHIDSTLTNLDGTAPAHAVGPQGGGSDGLMAPAGAESGRRVLTLVARGASGLDAWGELGEQQMQFGAAASPSGSSSGASVGASSGSSISLNPGAGGAGYVVQRLQVAPPRASPSSLLLPDASAPTAPTSLAALPALPPPSSSRLSSLLSGIMSLGEEGEEEEV